MHRKFIVAIETEVCDRHKLGRRPPLSNGKPKKVVTVWTCARAVFRHFCVTLSGKLLVAGIENVKASGNQSEASRGVELRRGADVDLGFRRCPRMAAILAWEKFVRRVAASPFRQRPEAIFPLAHPRRKVH